MKLLIEVNLLITGALLTDQTRHYSRSEYLGQLNHRPPTLKTYDSHNVSEIYEMNASGFAP